ncbi:uncharacterized protein LOC117901803 isoform X2 [Drosophila subobscura]|uniref:uncharacterized protein LOC117901803 isoform X2 n=1 Tax=Drosophila subobscura TaxID=7241 RepID=UPI00155A35DB|nr:uncharacterized protein LOC117901803 isoform X2 [Drosophila subobscura]
MSLFENENFAMEPLARLESVQHLHILGNNKTVSFREFFAALGRRTNPELQSLVMTSPLDFDETMELAKITSLTSFNGSLSDARSFQHLLHLSDFDVKEIFIRHIEFNKSTGVLLIRIWKDAQGSDTDLNPLARLPNLRHVTIEGPFKEGSMHSFFGQLATWQAETLQELDAGYYKMSNNELREVCRMRSLRTLNCSLSCAKDLEQLAELPQLAELIVVTHEKGSLQNLLAKLAGRESHTLEHLDVRSAALTPEEVKAVSAISSLKRLTSAFCCTEGLDVLSKRSCIDELVITTGKDETSPIDLLTAFGSLGESKIQNLKIKGPAADQEPAKVLDIVSQIPKLKSLEIPIKDTQGTEGLAESLHLETLTISSTPERGTLEGLFGALSLKASSKLKNLDLGRSFVGLEEARHLVQVDSITSLVCGFKDEESLSLLANMTNLETIDITSTHVFDTISGHLLEIFRGCRKLEYISLGSTNCRMWESFLKNSVDILKSVRDLSVQAPLNIRISTSSQAFTNEMTANDKMYLTVTSKSM